MEYKDPMDYGYATLRPRYLDYQHYLWQILKNLPDVMQSLHEAFLMPVRVEHGIVCYVRIKLIHVHESIVR